MILILLFCGVKSLVDAATCYDCIYGFKTCDSCDNITTNDGLHGIWSDWSDYTVCSHTYGLYGKKVQQRTCASWSYGCPCTGAYSRVVSCPIAPLCLKGSACNPPWKSVLLGCPNSRTFRTSYTQIMCIHSDLCSSRTLCGPVTRDDDYAEPLPCRGVREIQSCTPCPVGGVWSAWSNIGKCSATCDLCGVVYRNRTCESASYGCPCTGPTSQHYACPKKPCPKAPRCCGQAPNNIVAKNLVTKTNQCGLQLAPDQVLHPIHTYHPVICP